LATLNLAIYSKLGLPSFNTVLHNDAASFNRIPDLSYMCVTAVFIR